MLTLFYLVKSLETPKTDPTHRQTHEISRLMMRNLDPMIEKSEQERMIYIGQ